MLKQLKIGLGIKLIILGMPQSMLTKVQMQYCCILMVGMV